MFGLYINIYLIKGMLAFVLPLIRKYQRLVRETKFQIQGILTRRD